MDWRFFLMSTFWDEFDGLPSVIQGLAFALVAILIPLAIAILQDVYQKKTPDAKYVDLDLHVALDHVFRIKVLVLCLALIFLPMLFWDVSTGLLRWLLLAVSVSGIVVIVRLPLRNIYRWVKGNTFPFQLKYLANLRNDEDLPVVWRSVWQVQNIGIENETEFFKRFSNTVDRLMHKCERRAGLVATLLGDFVTFLDNRSTFLLATSKEALPNILRWHHTMWIEEESRLAADTGRGAWWPYFPITRCLELAIRGWDQLRNHP